MDFLRDLLMNNDGEAGMAGGPTSGTMDTGGMGGMGAMDASGGLGPTPGPSTMPMPPQPPSPVETQQQPQQGGMLPPSARQPGPIKRMLMDFSSTLRESLQKEMGVPTDTERAMAAQKMQMAQQAAANEHMFRQAQMKHYAADEVMRQKQLEVEQARAAGEKSARQNDPINWTPAQREAFAISHGITGDAARAFGASGKLPHDYGTQAKQDMNVQPYEDFRKGYPPTPQGQAKAATDWQRLQKPPKDTSIVDMKRTDRSYQYHTTQIDKLQKPIDDFNMRASRLRATLDQPNMLTDALAPPELMTVIAGGTGSGLRLNEAEIARVVGGTTEWQKLKSQLNRWSLDPGKAVTILPTQRAQMKALLGEVQRQLSVKTGKLNTAREEIVASDNPSDHKNAYLKLRKDFSIDEPAGKGAGELDIKTLFPNAKIVK